MKKFVSAIVMALVAITFVHADWSWGGDNSRQSSKADEPELSVAESMKLLTGEVPIDRVGSASNDTAVDEIVESILADGRQGRTIDGYDEVYSDPSVVEAIQKSDDVTARNLIKDKLCSLGLMACDYEDIEGKRPYLRPQDLIYAQPVAIRPVGQPVASVPYKGNNGPPRGGGPYGPPRPMQPPRKIGYDGPRPGGYDGPRPGSYGGPPNKGPFYGGGGGGPPGSYSSSGPGPIYSGPPTGDSNIIYSKPPGPIYEGPDSPPYSFEGIHSEKIHHHHQSVEKPAVIESSVNSVQQHVHHHYHHGEDGTNKIAVPVPIPVGISSGSNLIHNELSSASFSSGHSAGGGFNPINAGSFDYKDLRGQSGQSFSGLNEGSIYGGNVKPIFEGNNIPSNLNNQGPATFSSSGSGGFSASNNGIFNSQTASFHSSNPEYYKKQLGGGNAGPIQTNGLSSYATQQSYNSGGSYYSGDRYQGLETSRQENFDCVCVPYEQCPAQDIIGRKDDLFLPVDPRHIATDIEALSDEAVITDGNGTMTVVRVTKDTKNGTESIEAKKEEEVKKVSKRDVSNQASDKTLNDEIEKAKVEPVRIFIIIINCFLDSKTFLPLSLSILFTPLRYSLAGYFDKYVLTLTPDIPLSGFDFILKWFQETVSIAIPSWKRHTYKKTNKNEKHDHNPTKKLTTLHNRSHRKHTKTITVVWD